MQQKSSAPSTRTRSQGEAVSGPVGKLCARCRASLVHVLKAPRPVAERYADRLCAACWYDDEVTLQELAEYVTAQENAECEWQSMLAQCEREHRLGQIMTLAHQSRDGVILRGPVYIHVAE